MDRTNVNSLAFNPFHAFTTLSLSLSLSHLNLGPIDHPSPAIEVVDIYSQVKLFYLHKFIRRFVVASVTVCMLFVCLMCGCCFRGHLTTESVNKSTPQLFVQAPTD